MRMEGRPTPGTGEIVGRIVSPPRKTIVVPTQMPKRWPSALLPVAPTWRAQMWSASALLAVSAAVLALAPPPSKGNMLLIAGFLGVVAVSVFRPGSSLWKNPVSVVAAPSDTPVVGKLRARFKGLYWLGVVLLPVAVQIYMAFDGLVTWDQAWRFIGLMAFATLPACALSLARDLILKRNVDRIQAQYDEPLFADASQPGARHLYTRTFPESTPSAADAT